MRILEINITSSTSKLGPIPGRLGGAELVAVSVHDLVATGFKKFLIRVDPEKIPGDNNVDYPVIYAEFYLGDTNGMYAPFNYKRYGYTKWVWPPTVWLIPTDENGAIVPIESGQVKVYYADA